MTTTDPPINANKALWEKGDFTEIAASMRESGEALVAMLGITPGLDMLDLGCGDGTTALPAAQMGANATPLSAPAHPRFHLFFLIVGALSPPRPEDVAREVVRVTRPGGRIVMGNWIPNDPTLVAQILRISSAYSPPPPAGFVSPMTWGVEETVTERFAGVGVPAAQVSFERSTYMFNYPGTPAQLLDVFRRYYGPTMNAYAAAAASGREEELHGELETLFNAQNASPTDATTSIPATFLRVTVTV